MNQGSTLPCTRLTFAFGLILALSFFVSLPLFISSFAIFSIIHFFISFHLFFLSSLLPWYGEFKNVDVSSIFLKAVFFLVIKQDFLYMCLDQFFCICPQCERWSLIKVHFVRGCLAQKGSNWINFSKWRVDERWPLIISSAIT